MIIDLTHNKIVAATVTAGFESSVEEKLIPALCAKYGDTEIVGIQMYEDYISDNFLKSGYWYYPLTVVTEEGCFTEWVKWAVNNDNFDGGVPYAYVGESAIDFKITENVPTEFEERLVGRARFCEEGLIKIRVETSMGDITRLSGKYSQTFIDEMARQLTAAIRGAMAVEGLAESSVELSLVFAPGTYMEHISENVTYRRLVLSDKSSAPRDFWIKWTRLDGAVAYSVASNIGAENILFELGEDVSQKIREKEYRYLLSAGKDKYHAAMGRKNVTEWREVIKRAIRRGELVKVETPVELSAETLMLEEKLADVLGRAGVSIPEEKTVEEPVRAADSEAFELAMQKMREMALGSSLDENAAEETDADLVEETVDDSAEETDDSSDGTIVFEDLSEEGDSGEEDDDPKDVEFFEEEDEEEEEELDELEALYAEDDSALDISEGAVAANDEEAAELEEITRLALEALKEAQAETADPSSAEADDAEEDAAPLADGDPDEIVDAEDEEEVLEIEESDEDEEILAELRALDPDEDTDEDTFAEADAAPMAATVADEDTVRAEIEAKIRLEYEERARKMAEAETARILREQEAIRLENERILSEARREQEKLRLEYEKLLQETKRINEERAALDAARRAEEEKLRAQIEAQLRQEARERERLAEAARLAIEEQRRLEEENARREREREEEERRIEAERLNREAEERAAAERAAEVERIRREEDAARAAAAALAAAEAERYSYTSKTVRFIFRRSVDPNITARIHEIIKATIEYYGKDKIFMKIRASVPDSQTVTLEFVQIPAEEMELLGNIIKILGNSGLGIAKAIVE